MHDEAAFLARIRETPDDVAPRLVYADWLDEHDDPRGELIRVTEEMRTLAPYSDAYWALKPRRKALRDGVANEWLETLRYNDVWPVLTHGFPDGWRERWRLIREFVERWHGIAMDDVGGRYLQRVAEIEDRFECVLPPSMREFVALVEDLSATDNEFAVVYLYDYAMPNIEANGDKLFRIYGDGWHFLRIRFADMDKPDPPVYQSDDDRSSLREARLSRPLSMSIWYVIGNYSPDLGGCFVSYTTDPELLIQKLTEVFPVHYQFEDVHFFEMANGRATLGPERSGHLHLFSVNLARRFPRQMIPSFFWEYAAKSENASGVFGTDQ